MPELTGEQLDRAVAELLELSFVRTDGTGGSLHDEARRYLLGQWIASRDTDPERWRRFREANARLAEHYASPQDRGADAAAGRSEVYHRIAAGEPGAVGLFRERFAAARLAFRLEACEALVAIVADLEPLLGEGDRGWLRYARARLLADRRHYDQARSMLEPLRRRSGDCGRRRPDRADPALPPRRPARPARLRRRARDARDVARLSRRQAGGARAAAGGDAGDGGAASEDARHAAGRGAARGPARRPRDPRRSFTARAHLEHDGAGAPPAQPPAAGARRLRVGARRCSRRPASGSGRCRCHNNIGALHAERADWDAARESLERALAIAREAGDYNGEATALGNLQRVYAGLSRPDDADAAAERAVELFRSIHNWYAAANLSLGLAKRRRRAGQAAEARASFLTAAELYRLAGDGRAAARARAAAEPQGVRSWALWQWLLLALGIVLGVVAIVAVVVFVMER